MPQVFEQSLFLFKLQAAAPPGLLRQHRPALLRRGLGPLLAHPPLAGRGHVGCAQSAAPIRVRRDQEGEVAGELPDIHLCQSDGAGYVYVKNKKNLLFSKVNFVFLVKVKFNNLIIKKLETLINDNFKNIFHVWK